MHDSFSQQKPSLTVWAVTDNKPGHQNQVEGLVEALSNYRKVNLNWMHAINFTTNIWMLLTKRCDDCSGNTPDLIVGAGHHTHLTLLALKRCCGGRVIIMMSPSLPLGFFDLCFIPRHDNPPQKANVVETLGAINRMIPSQSQLSETGLILIGGPSRHYDWNSEAVINQVLSVIEKNSSVQWIIAGSRRTPDKCYKALRSHFPDSMIVPPEEVSKDWLPLKMQETEQIWVTSDSISMIYEALTSGAVTGVLRLDYERSSRVSKEIDRLIAERRIHTLSQIKYIVSEKEVTSTLYEADRCAKLLLKKMDL